MDPLGKYSYMYFWSKILFKLDYDIDKPMFHYKNLKATIWILCFNPLIIKSIIAIILVLLISLNSE